MFTGKLQILQSEGKTFENEKKQSITFYKVAVLLPNGSVVKLSTTKEVFAVINGMVNVQGEASIELKSTLFNGKEGIKALMVSFTPSE